MKVANDLSATPIGGVTAMGVKDLKDYEDDQERTGGAFNYGGSNTSNRRGRKQPLMFKLLSHKLPLSLGLSPGGGTHVASNASRLEEADRVSVLQYHKEAKSQFEQTTIIEIYENRIGMNPQIWIGYILVGLVIASGAAFVPLGVALDVSNPMLKVLWRVATMLPFLGVLGFI